MTALLIIAAATTSLSLQTPMTPTRHSATEVAAICFKTGEQSSGMNKICYYDCMGSANAVTIGAVELCPLSIND